MIWYLHILFSLKAVTTTTTARNPQLASIGESFVPDNQLKLRNFSYEAAITDLLTLKLVFENNQNHDWYVDDASIKGSSSG